jgi:hypothetical protein
MSNQINPFNYNVDNFDSGFLGPISDGDFREYLYKHNLDTINPIIGGILGINDFEGRDVEYDVSQSNPNVIDVPNLLEVATTPSEYNNFTNPTEVNTNKNADLDDFNNWYPQYNNTFNQNFSTYKTSYGLPETLKIEYVGNTEQWVSQGGYLTNVYELRDSLYFGKENKYGPNDILRYNSESFNGSDLISQNTGFIEYNTRSTGDFRDQLLSRSLGVGIIPFSQFGSGINYKPDGKDISELDKIARKRRGDEILNRIKLNFVDNTVGAINTSPFGLLAGGNLIQRDYKITVPKTGVGKAAQFLSSLAGFSVPTSIIPEGSFGDYNVEKGTVDISKDLLDYTGSGQKSLLYDALYINKYGPVLEVPGSQQTSGQVKRNLAGAGQPPITTNYLTSTGEINQNESKRGTSVIDSINDKVKEVLKQNKKLPQKPSPDYEGVDPILTNSNFGFDTLERDFYNEEDTWDEGERGGGVIGTLSPSGSQTPGGPSDIQGDKSLKDGMYWAYRERNPFKKGVLKYTQDLINKSINNPNSAGKFIGVVNDDTNFKSNKHPNKHSEKSMGNTVRTGDEEAYCRSWSIRRPYINRDDLIRSSGNFWKVDKDNENLLTLNWNKNGLPKIAYEVGDKAGVIPYMFSIENLAWKNSPHLQKLSDCEKGPNGGRIMWFPPYNISFTDNTSVSWDSTSIIGRGENIYTYNNTERSGTLDFDIIVDHPDIINQIKSESKDSLERFFAGCGLDDIKKIVPNLDIDTETTKKPKTLEEIKPRTPSKPDIPLPIEVYFDNARSDSKCKPKDSNCRVLNIFDVGRSLDFNYESTSVTCNGETREGLNEDLENKIDELCEFLVGKGKYDGKDDGKNYTIVLNGFASGQAPKYYNEKLSWDRVNAVKSVLVNKMIDLEGDESVKIPDTDKYYPLELSLQTDRYDNFLNSGTNNTNGRWGLYSRGESGASPLTQDEDFVFESSNIDPCTSNSKNSNSYISKTSRKVTITLVENTKYQTELLGEIKKEGEETFYNTIKEEEIKKQEIIDKINNDFVTECQYFEKIKNDSPFLYNDITEKIKNFHPAFHSMTPEGLNKRLTFLLQCTRQGPQIYDQETPQNMVFGRPPVCILKIGDFYHTKIIIDSINISYDPLLWDLNPEGIGVQPMLAKVSIGFKYIGGSSLGGPIQQLQNAVSYNFFANTSIYLKANKFSEDKFNFIYGSFVTPDQEKSLVSQLNNKTENTNDNKNNTNTTNEGTERSLNENQINKINENADENLNSNTSSDSTNNPPNVVNSDISRLELVSEYETSNNTVRFVIKRKNSSDNTSLKNDYKISFIDLIALDNEFNSVKNIPTNTVISATDLVTSSTIFVSPPIDLSNFEKYSMTVKFDNGVDTLNSGLKII